MKNLINRFLVPVAYLAMIVINYLAMALPIGGRTTGEISDGIQNLFTPAGYAFSIWGIIYMLLAIYIIYQFSRTEDKVIARINPIFILNALLNAAWIFAWHYNIIWLSVIIMLGLLVTLIKIADILRQNTLSKKDYFLINLPFSIYFGWITVATIANITVLLVSLGWGRFGLAESIWAVSILLVGAAIGIWRALYDRSIPYALVLVWAYGAILFKHLSANGFGGAYPTIIATTVVCLVVFVVTIVYLSLKKEKNKKVK